MKLNSAQIERTLQQVNAEAIPADHPVVPQLERLFGDHTYFLDSAGLSIVEPIETDSNGGPMGVVTNLANWTDARAPKLMPHDPEPTDVVVVLEGKNAN